MGPIRKGKFGARALSLDNSPPSVALLCVGIDPTRQEQHRQVKYRAPIDSPTAFVNGGR